MQLPNFISKDSIKPTADAPIRYRLIAWLFISLTFFLTYSCTYFTVQHADISGLQAALEKDKVVKTVIIHAGENQYVLDDIDLKDDQISGIVRDSTAVTYYYEPGKKTRIKPDEKTIVHEVHIYLNSITSLELGENDIPVAFIEEIRIINLDTGATVLIVVATLAVITLVLLIIIQLTKSSCPYVYSHDGEDFVYQGELYGGAIGKNLERDDYLPLTLIKPINNQYRIRISNELKERQYTDLAQLVVVEHPEHSKVLVDQNGELHLVKEAISTQKALTKCGDNVANILEAPDGAIYAFDDLDYPVNAIELEFEACETNAKGNLTINAKNTLYFDYQFGKLLEKFGGLFDQRMESQAKIPTEERLQQGRDRHIPLAVYLKVDNKWELVEYINTVGPMAYREISVPIDLAKVTGSKIQIKLETGFNFWEIDEVKLNYEEAFDLDVKRLNPVATNTSSAEKASLVAETDGQYLAQVTGDLAELIYDVPELSNGLESTVFLHTRGYYELVRDFSGPPQLLELNKFKDPIWLAEYSRLQYIETIKEQQLVDNATAQNIAY